jgi:iron(III) transport system permease protein
VIFRNTLLMGLLTAALGTILGFIFAYTVVRCRPPGKALINVMALVPTVSPPFALALSTILLFGRNGLITAKLFGMTFPLGRNDIYGLDGLVFVQVITFFGVGYLIIRAMLERLDPSMEEAAHSLGAGKFHIFRTVTLPLLVPGLAASFLLLFVESLADLGNPLFISGNFTVLSAQIFLAVAGEYDYQKASSLALVLLIPTLIVFLLQRYYVGRRSYVSVTGKPTGGHITVKEPLIRWPFIAITYATCILVLILYLTIVYGSFATAWGVDYTPTLTWWKLMAARGIESILDTTFLSAYATPLAALTGMVIAFLVVRRQFSGKAGLDFVSNLGGAVPGTILGIGFVLAFSTVPKAVVGILYVLLAVFLVGQAIRVRRAHVSEENPEENLPIDRRARILTTAWRVGTVVVASTAGLLLAQLTPYFGEQGAFYLVGLLYLLVGVVLLVVGRVRHRRARATMVLLMGVYVLAGGLVEYVAVPIAVMSRSIPPGFWANFLFQFSDYIRVPFQTPLPLDAIIFAFLSLLVIEREEGTARIVLTGVLLALVAMLCFSGQPLALIGTPYIILAAFAVRSLPASVRAGTASLQQIDPSIEEASGMLGGDAQYTFRKVTLPLIMPALLAGLIFAFTRHMTSLSAIIFLISARWRIVTASILSEWEQGGVSIAAAYSTVIIVLVLIAIGVLYYVTRRVLRGRGDVDLDLSLGG